MAYQSRTRGRLLGAAAPRGVRALRLLLDELDELGPVPARARAGSLLRQLPVDAVLKDFVLRVLHWQRATDGLVDTLTALADFLESGISAHSAVSPPTFSRLAVRPNLDERSHVAIIPASDVVYAFTVAAMTQGFVKAAWRLDLPRREQGVYLRVNRFKDLDPQGVGVLATPYRTLGDLRVLLDPARFVPANQSIVVNCAYIHDLETSPPVDLRVALADGRLESLRVSRKHWRTLRLVLGLPARMCQQPIVTGAGP
jgi:LytTr DNA-binding domain-containing protein